MASSNNSNSNTEKVRYVNPDSGKPAPDNPHLAGDSPIELLMMNKYWDNDLQDFNWARFYEYEWSASRIARYATANGFTCGTSRARRIRDTFARLRTQGLATRPDLNIPATYKPLPDNHTD